jgi:hypothetical protein
MKIVEFIIDENQDDYGVFAISLVDKPAIEEDFMYFSEAKQKFATIDNDERIVMGAVMIPDLEILRIDEKGEKYKCWFSKETIKRVSELYMIESHHKNATLDHSRTINGITTVESWIVADSKKDKTQAFGLEYPVGTWVATMKIDNEDVWQNYVKEGVVKGFSVEGYFAESHVKMSEQNIIDEIKKIILEDENKTL